MDVELQQVRSYTGPEIAAMTEDRPTWLAAPWVAKGAITEVSGKVKLAGKTTLLAHICGAIVNERPFLGRPTQQSPVLYVTEQTPETFRQSLRNSGTLESEQFHGMFLGDFRNAKQDEWTTLVLLAGQEAARVGARVIVFDTLMQLAGVRDEHDAAEAVKVMEPVQTLASLGYAIIVSRHDRKAGGDVGDSSRGSSAYAGAVDVLIQVQRKRGRPSNVRELNAVSRYDETPSHMNIELTDDGYIVAPIDEHDDAEERPSRHDTARQVLGALNDQWATARNVANITGIGESTVQRHLKDLRAQGKVTAEPGKDQKSPWTYRLASDPSRVGFRETPQDTSSPSVLRSVLSHTQGIRDKTQHNGQPNDVEIRQSAWDEEPQA